MKEELEPKAPYKSRTCFLFPAILYAAFTTAVLLTPATLWASGPACFENEIDPATRKIYANPAQYDADFEELMAQEPADPGLLRLYRGYQIYKDAGITKKSFRNDKISHCYVGCLITGLVDAETGTYAAWYKEKKDITDCAKKTQFEWEDIKATLRGVLLATKNPKVTDYAAFCRAECRKPRN